MHQQTRQQPGRVAVWPHGGSHGGSHGARPAYAASGAPVARPGVLPSQLAAWIGRAGEKRVARLRDVYEQHPRAVPVQAPGSHAPGGSLARQSPAPYSSSPQPSAGLLHSAAQEPWRGPGGEAGLGKRAPAPGGGAAHDQRAAETPGAAYPAFTARRRSDGRDGAARSPEVLVLTRSGSSDEARPGGEGLGKPASALPGPEPMHAQGRAEPLPPSLPFKNVARIDPLTGSVVAVGTNAYSFDCTACVVQRCCCVFRFTDLSAHGMSTGGQWRVIADSRCRARSIF